MEIGKTPFIISKMQKRQQSELVQLNKKQELEVRAYKRRWFIIATFIYYSAVNSFQWIEYSSITDLVSRYYKVSSLAVDWTSIIYMALYPIFVIPACYLTDKQGLRTVGLIGCLGTALGTSLKVLSIGQNLFWVVMLGQSIVSISQTVILCLPPKIAAVWFKPNEVSTACSLGVFGTQLGCAIGFILCPILVRPSENLDDIGADLRFLCWMLTASMVPVSLAIIFYFEKQPPLPPSPTQALERRDKEEFKISTFFHSIKKLFLDKGFFIHMIAYSINIGVFSGVGTLLTQFILSYFENAHKDAGQMGFVMIIVGMVGSVVFGIFLDKTHKYKETTLFLYFLSGLSVVGLMYSLEYHSMLFSYISCALIGLSTNAYMPAGFELAMELTFPSEEATTTGILMSMTQVLGLIFACGLGHLKLWVGSFWALGSQALLLFLGTVITAFVPNTLKRQEAFRINSPQVQFKPVALNIK